MSWKSFEIPKVPEAASDAAAGLSTIVGTTSAVLTILRDLTKTLAALQVSSLSFSQQLVQTAVKTIEDNLNSLLSGGGVYVLYVPPRRRVEIPEVVRAAMTRVGMTELPSVQLASEILNLESRLDAPTKMTLPRIMAASGGNAGFTRTVIESLTDEADVNRPKPLDSDHVYGLLVLAGSDDYRSVLEFTTALKGTMGGGLPAMETSLPGLPIPQRVRARQVSEGGTLVEWAFQTPIVRKASIDTVAQVHQVAVVRAKSAKALTCATFQELFGTTPIKQGLTKNTQDDEVSVVSVQDFNSVAPPQSALDPGPLTKDQGYYYAVGFNLKLGDASEIAQGTAETQGFNRLSSWVKVVPREAPVRTMTGTPPDWLRTPSVMSLVPDLASALQQLSSQVTQLAGNASGFGEMLKNHVSFIEQEILQFEQVAQSVLSTLERLTANASAGVGSAGAYVRSIDGQGGLPFITKDLTRAFVEDGSPPFTKGDEFVAGMVILTYGPSSAAIQPVKALLDLLFGNAVSSVSAVRQAIAAIDVEIAAVEALIADAQVPERAKVGEDDDGSTDLNCPRPKPTAYDFGGDLKVKE